jgi:hypothetical protein
MARKPRRRKGLFGQTCPRACLPGHARRHVREQYDCGHVCEREHATGQEQTREHVRCRTVLRQAVSSRKETLLYSRELLRGGINLLTSIDGRPCVQSSQKVL